MMMQLNKFVIITLTAVILVSSVAIIEADPVNTDSVATETTIQNDVETNALPVTDSPNSTPGGAAYSTNVPDDSQQDEQNESCCIRGKHAAQHNRPCDTHHYTRIMIERMRNRPQGGNATLIRQYRMYGACLLRGYGHVFTACCNRRLEENREDELRARYRDVSVFHRRFHGS